MRHPTARNRVARLLLAVGLCAVAVALPVGAGAAPGQDPTTTQVVTPTSAPPADPLGCEALVWDPEDVLAGDDTVRAAAEELQADGYDVRVRVEPPTDGDIDTRLAQVEEACPGWTVDGDRPADRVIVMLQPSSRSTGLWYGVAFSDALADRWESIQVDDMNPRFRRGDFAGGLAAGLERLAGSRSRSGSSGAAPDRSPFDTSSSDGRSGRGPGLSLFGPFLILGLVIAVGWGFSYLSWKAKYDRGEVTGSFGEYRSSSGGGGYRRSRSFGSSRRSSGGSRRSSGGGRRSSGGGGRRSGGGSTRW